MRGDALAQRIAYRTLMMLAATADDRTTAPEIALLIDARLHTVAATLAKRRDDWGASLGRKLLDPDARAKLAGPIGGEDGYMNW